MTNKIINGVDRDLIQRIADHCKFWVDHPYLEAISDVEADLRALLDANDVGITALASELLHDRAYRDGLKRGFGLGENGQVEQYRKEFGAYQTGIIEAGKDNSSPIKLTLSDDQILIARQHGINT